MKFLMTIGEVIMIVGLIPLVISFITIFINRPHLGLIFAVIAFFTVIPGMFLQIISMIFSSHRKPKNHKN